MSIKGNNMKNYIYTILGGAAATLLIKPYIAMCLAVYVTVFGGQI